MRNIRSDFVFKDELLVNFGKRAKSHSVVSIYV